MRDLPFGTVTFLFTDVEGSTKLLHELGAEGYAQALGEHRRVLREAFTRHGGVEVDTQGDAFFVAFPTAPGALQAAMEAQTVLAEGPIRVRMGIHTGTPHVAEEGYVGADVHRAARIAAVGHGGQVLVSSSTASLVASDGLRDLGEHRLKDLSAPERIYQLGDGDFPPLASLHQTNLPIPATSFLGREREVAEIGALLARKDVRLLTLTGPGGTGKTRLALQAAGAAADAFPHGVYWVPLAPLRDPALVLDSAAHAVGTKDGLAEHVGDKSMLLLFDNFEHVVEAADDLFEALAACPNLDLLVTSRELLALPGEQAYPVPPLEPADGAELFLARARAAMPSFEPSAAVHELCARLENLPLALELAAARVRLLSPEQLLERLSKRLDLLKAGRGADPRQQTLRATIEWSYDLLDEHEQRLFARLSVFRGGCTLETAEEVCEADLDVLQSLVDKSLVRVREGERFWMLETIREYAAERLAESGEEDESLRAHAEHFVALAEEAQPNLRGSPKEWLDRLELEHDNLRAALDWLDASGETELALRGAAALWRFWSMRGYVREGRRRFERLLTADAGSNAARANALNGGTVMALNEGDPVAARRHAEEALALHREDGDPWAIANSKFLLGMVCAEDEDWPAARELFEDSLETFRDLGDDHYTMLVGRNLAWIHYELGERDRGRALHEENLRRARAVGNKRIEASTLQGLAWRAVDEGRPYEAISMLKQSYAINLELGERVSIADDLARLARAMLALGRHDATTTLLSAMHVLCLETGAAVEGAETKRLLSIVQDELDEAAFAEAWERGQAMTPDEAVALAVAALE